mmetsp:Transcript_7833/g.22972  ORF Transcript_7833/g.22972 Transcript_7833/m.22972 type:complete len:369 (-) Transcript_7833:67-1173(-)
MPPDLATRTRHPRVRTFIPRNALRHPISFYLALLRHALLQRRRPVLPAQPLQKVPRVAGTLLRRRGLPGDPALALPRHHLPRPEARERAARQRRARQADRLRAVEGERHGRHVLRDARLPRPRDLDAEDVWPGGRLVVAWLRALRDGVRPASLLGRHDQGRLQEGPPHAAKVRRHEQRVRGSGDGHAHAKPGGADGAGGQRQGDHGARVLRRPGVGGPPLKGHQAALQVQDGQRGGHAQLPQGLHEPTAGRLAGQRVAPERRPAGQLRGLYVRPQHQRRQRHRRGGGKAAARGQRPGRPARLKRRGVGGSRAGRRPPQVLRCGGGALLRAVRRVVRSGFTVSVLALESWTEVGEPREAEHGAQKEGGK